MTPRQLLILIGTALLVSAAAIGVIVGGAGDPFDHINGAKFWLIGLGLVMGFVLLCAVVHKLSVGILSLVLGWAMGRTGVEVIRVFGYVLVSWIGVMLVVAVTWAWLGHDSAWRVAPRQWLMSGDVAHPDGRGQLGGALT